MSFREKLAGIPKPNLAGFLGPLIGLISILVAVLLLPGFSWQSNPLSDLGSWFRTDLGNLQILSAVKLTAHSKTLYQPKTKGGGYSHIKMGESYHSLTFG